MEASRKLYPEEFLRKHIAQGVRPDGRTLTKFRKPRITIGSVNTADGSCMVKLGNTTVVAGVKAELGPAASGIIPGEAGSALTYASVPIPKPSDKHHRCGQIAINVDLPPLCSPKFRGGRLPDEASVIAQRLNNLVRNGDLIPKDRLVFDEDGKYVWYLSVDMYCINYDGSAFDAFEIALIGALCDVTLCRGTVVDEEKGIFKKDATTESRIALSSVPIASSFVLFDQSVLADPTSEEEALMLASMSVVCDGKGTLFELSKPGGTPLDEETIDSCVRLAVARAASIEVLLKDKLKK